MESRPSKTDTEDVKLTVRNCCPICGYEFDIVRDINVCPTQHYGRQNFTPHELISSDDDYMWCQ